MKRRESPKALLNLSIPINFRTRIDLSTVNIAGILNPSKGKALIRMQRGEC